MNDWATDFMIYYVEDGQRRQMIWSGYTLEEAIKDFSLAYPECRVIEEE